MSKTRTLFAVAEGSGRAGKDGAEGVPVCVPVCVRVRLGVALDLGVFCCFGSWLLVDFFAGINCGSEAINYLGSA